MKINSYLLILAAVGLNLFASQAVTVERDLSVSGPILLDVMSDHGGIDVKAEKADASSNPSVHVRAIIRPLYGKFDLGLAEASIRELQRHPPIEQTGSRIRIGYAPPDLLRAVSIRFEIRVPRETAIHARTVSGGIRVAGTNGTANVETSSGGTEITGVHGSVLVAGHSGAIAIRSIVGNVSAQSESGGIQLADLQGTVDVQTTSGRTEISEVVGELHSITHSGSISIDNAHGAVTTTNGSGGIDAFQIAGPVQARTQSGAIRIAQIGPAPIRAQSRSGAITVDLASGHGYRIDAQSHSGKVSGPRHGTLEMSAAAHRLQAQVGSGGPLVDLDTQSSKIQVD